MKGKHFLTAKKKKKLLFKFLNRPICFASKHFFIIGVRSGGLSKPFSKKDLRAKNGKNNVPFRPSYQGGRVLRKLGRIFTVFAFLVLDEHHAPNLTWCSLKHYSDENNIYINTLTSVNKHAKIFGLVSKLTPLRNGELKNNLCFINKLCYLTPDLEKTRNKMEDNVVIGCVL